MVIGRRVAKRKGQHLIALSPEVRARLGVIPGQWLYFHLGRKGEVVLSMSPARAGGKPPTAGLEERLATALAVSEQLRQRGESRDRAMYAEGYALGRQDQAEVMVKPSGKRASDLRRRRLAQYAWGEKVPAGYVRVEEVRRPRRASRVETVEALVLAEPDAREQIDAAAARLGAGIGFALPAGVVAVTVPDPDEPRAPAHPLPSGVSSGGRLGAGGGTPQGPPWNS